MNILELFTQRDRELTELTATLETLTVETSGGPIAGALTLQSRSEYHDGLTAELVFSHPYWGDETIAWTVYNGLDPDTFNYYISGTTVPAGLLHNREELFEDIRNQVMNLQNTWKGWDEQRANEVV